ncbi:MAG: ABC transporter ATP-binding protein [Chromatiales bacterium 21-64-14]|nr:MAG: ABC transporter ATP-binding protein [Chromatiales bacterium 21-64-14]HQU16440.1 ABC transporter ATP-binding protein [Gammaproteobacteria bacterium]
MTEVLLSIEGLETRIGDGATAVRAVDGLNLAIRRGETFALLGESGCGKSMTALSILRLVPQPAGRIVAGRVMLRDRNLLELSEAEMRRVRGGQIGMIFQEPMTSLNPVLTVGRQIGEAVQVHQGLRGAILRRRTLELLDAVGLPDPPRRIGEYPHQLSGGMKQRVMIAIALAGEPQLLIADEPTTALDVTIQAQVLELLRGLQRDTGMALLLITHDLGVVAQTADRVGVMYAGHVVEEAPRAQFFAAPRHPYSRKLFESLPGMEKREHALAVIPGSVPSLAQIFPGCRFAERCGFAWDTCRATVPVWSILPDGHGVRCHRYDPRFAAEGPREGSEPAAPVTGVTRAAAQRDGELLQVDGLKVYFPIHTGLFQRASGWVHAVDGVSLEVRGGRTLALVGESGCGKTTVAKGILQLIRPTAGHVRFAGAELTELRGAALRRRRADLQIIFQDPYSSMNPRMMVGDIVEEGMTALGVGADRAARRARVAQLLEQVGLTAAARERYPHEFSGGQRQRICIARALAVSPKLIVCDEPTSALDVSVQAQILNLLNRLQAELGLSFLFITHNLAVVSYLAHEVAVMYLGRIVERGTVEEVLRGPLHPYTQALLSAVPVIEPESRREVIRLEGDPPSPVHPPLGCHFHARCPQTMPICRERYPEETRVSATHRVLCHLHGP